MHKLYFWYESAVSNNVFFETCKLGRDIASIGLLYKEILHSTFLNILDKQKMK